jgi:ankyrin repeat protein
MDMKNIKGYTEHLKESQETPEELGQRLIRILYNKTSPNIEEVKRLIEAGADTKTRDEIGWTPLHYAAYNGYTEAAKVLIQAGAGLEAKTWDSERTPLNLAAIHGRTGSIKALIRAGADLEAKASDDTTPLHVATYWGQTGAMKALIQAGADLEARTIGGRTPLYYASMHGRTEIARALIEAGADISAGFDSLDELEDRFGGDISWIPQERIPPEWRKRARSRGAFGRF